MQARERAANGNLIEPRGQERRDEAGRNLPARKQRRRGGHIAGPVVDEHRERHDPEAVAELVDRVWPGWPPNRANWLPAAVIRQRR